ncbi:MAG: phytase, partial [Porticoccaceae bacterium]
MKSQICNKIILVSLVSLIGACSQYPDVTAKFETPEVTTHDDAADDPAIWVDAQQPENSLIFGTDKKSGVHVYNLQGQEIGYTKLGDINNIDLRSQGGVTKIVASNRTNETIDLWLVSDSSLQEGAKKNQFALDNQRSVRANSAINIYGICAGNDPEFGFIAFVTEDEGPRVEMWQYSDAGLSLLTTFNNGGESEGCVYDDENRRLFISEEETNGVLKAYSIDQTLDFSNFTTVDSRKGNIVGDPEGVAIYKTNNTDGFIVLSSQGDSKFNLYDRKPPYQYVGSFSVKAGLGATGLPIDEISTTDGIEVINLDFNSHFPEGLMVIQDDVNTVDKESKLKRQNFKLVSFRDIINALSLIT